MFQELIEKLTRLEDLTTDEASAAMAEVMEGGAAPAHIAGLLIGLAMKGERPVEIVGLARAMRAHAVRLSRRYDDVFDTCGTGGDRAGTINISSCAALVVAAAGVRVAKHGNRSASSKAGGADVYEALGVRVSAPPAVVGLPKAPAGSLQGGDARENARIIEGLLDGTRGPARDVVLLNAGAALFVAGAASSVDEGILKALRAIDRGDAKKTLAQLVSISTAGEAAAGASA